MRENNPPFLSSFILNESISVIIMEAKMAYNPVVVEALPHIVIGEKMGPMPTERVASTMQLPIISQIMRS